MKRLIVLAMIATIPLSAMDIELGTKSKKLPEIKHQKKRTLCRDSAFGGIGLTAMAMGTPLVIGILVWSINNFSN